MSAWDDPRRGHLIIFAVRVGPAGGLPEIPPPNPAKFRQPANGSRVKLCLEYAACGAVDPGRIATRGYRNQRHTLRSEEIFSLFHRQLAPDEGFDLFAIELLHSKMRSEPVIDELGRRVFGAGEKIRAHQQHPRRKSMRPRLDPVRSLVKFLDLII